MSLCCAFAWHFLSGGYAVSRHRRIGAGVHEQGVGMRSSISLGSIGGVRIGLNWSVLVIVAILVFGLALGSFPLTYPGYPTVVYLLAGLVAAVLFLGSLLAHEVAHALVARHHGIEVAGITLWLLGGVAQLRGRSEEHKSGLQ